MRKCKGERMGMWLFVLAAMEMGLGGCLQSTFNDELDVLNGILNEYLALEMKPGRPIMLVGGAEEFDKNILKYGISNGKSLIK